MSSGRARAIHAVTAAVTWSALVLQLVLVLRGGRVLDDVYPPALAVRLGRLVSYFTIESNLLVAVTTTELARDSRLDGRWWRVARLAGLVGIVITGLVHFVALRPLLDLHGADRVADLLLHQAVPVLAVLGWLLVGPRPRTGVREVAFALAWPVAWLGWTLLTGWWSGWYPYPFLDHRQHGGAHVALACVGVAGLFLGCFIVAAVLDRWAPPAPGRDGWT